MTRFLLLLAQIEQLRFRIRLNPYFFTVCIVIVFTIFRYEIRSFLGDSYPAAMFIIPVIISAWYGGFRTGMLATLLSLIIAIFFFALPHYTFSISSPQDKVSLLIFLIEGFLLSFFATTRNLYQRELTSAKNRAEDAVKSREEFMAITAHELKNPLTSQLVLLDVLKKQLARNPVAKNLIKKITTQSDRLLQHISNLTEVARIQSGQFELDFKPINLNDLVQNIVDSFPVSHKSHTIYIKGTVKKKVFADQIRITQVIENLLSNAIKYSPDAKKVIIHLSQTSKEAIVSVQDFGIGINKDQINKIFTRYYRVQGTNQSTFSGFGIGLFLVLEIMSLHKGRIWVESTPGSGSIFRISLPLTRHH